MFRFGVLGRVLAAVVASSLFVFGLNALPASAAPAAAAADGFDDFSAQDFVSAQIKAKSLGHKVLVVDELSDVSTSWVNVDGTVTTDVAGSPVRVKDVSGKFGWRDLDYTLEFNSDGSVGPVSGLYPLSLSGGGTAAEVAVSGLASVAGSNGLQIGFGWPAALPKPTLDGECALYADVLPDADIRVCLTADGFEQFFILKAKPTQEVLNALALPLNLSHATVVSDGVGGFSFKDSTGGVVGSVPTPSVQDTADLPNADASVLHPDLAPTNVAGSAAAVLRLNLDASYFDEPALVYPVVVDPQVSLGASFNTFVSSANPTTDYSASTELLVGTPDAGISKYRSYLNFDGKAYAGATVTSASLNLWLNWSWSCTPTALTVYAAKPAISSTRWGAQPTIYSNYSGSVTTAAGYNSSCPASVQTIDVTSPIAAEAKNNWSTAGLTLRASESASSGWKRFYSANAATHKPQLKVTYNHLPVVPTPKIVNALTVGGVLYTADAQPTFTLAASDGDAQKLSYTFKYLRTNGTNVWWVIACSAGPLASGATASCQSTPTLADRTSYSVYVDVTDGIDTVTSSVGVDFVTDLSAPAPPSFTQCAVANNSWVASVATNTVCPIAAANGVTLMYSVNGGAYQNANGLGVSIPLSNTASAYEITAYTLGASGLVSTPTTQRFAIGAGAMIGPKPNSSSNNSVLISAFGHNTAGNPTSAGIYFQPAGDTGWIPTNSNPSVSVVNGVSGVYDYNLNLGSLGFPNNGVSPMNLKVCFVYPVSANNYCTAPTFITYNPNSFAGSQPVASAGVATVNLRNGDTKFTATDVSIQTPAGGFTVSRALTTNTSPLNDFAGTGWQTIIDGGNTGLTSYNISTNLTGLISFDDHQGSAFFFLKNVYTPVGDQTIAAGLKLQSSGSGTSLQYTLTATDGWQTNWVQNSGVWVVGSVTDPTHQFSYCTKFYDTNKPSMLRQAPGQVSNLCTTVAAGTKELTLTYGGVTSGTDYLGALKDVTFSTYKTATSNPWSAVVASYTYNTSGSLRTVSDPRTGYTTEYEYEYYDYSGGTYARPTSVTASGLASYRYFYSGNKLIRVARDNTLYPANGYSVENTYLYGANVSAANLPPITLDKIVWGQSVSPNAVTISFGPDSNLLTSSPTTPVTVSSLSSSQLKQGSYTYFDALGRQTNSADWGSSKWLYSYQQYDSNDNLITSFDQSGIYQLQQRILTEPNVDVHQFATDYRYNDEYTTIDTTKNPPITATMPAGVQLLDVWQPIESIAIADQSILFRTHTKYSYDQNAPNGDINPLTTSVYGLVTDTKIGLVLPSVAQSGGADSVVLGETKTNYDDQVTGHTQASNTSGWVIGKPTKTSFYDSARLLTGESVAVYNSFGQVAQSAGVGQNLQGVNGANFTSALATSNTYYSSDANSQQVCGFQAEYDGLLCSSNSTSVSSSSIQSTLVNSYSHYSDALSTTELGSGNVTKTTSNTYTLDGRIDTSSVTVANVAGNVATPATNTLYDSATGQQIGQKQTVGGVTTQTFATFDTWGRVATYTNSVGDVTTTTYVPYGTPGAGQIATETTVDSAGVPVLTDAYTYDGTDILGGIETRGLLTKKVVTTGAAQNNIITYNAAYNDLGDLLKQTSSGGLSQTYEYDDNGRLTDTSYSGTDASTGTPTDVTWFTWSKTFDTAGKISTLTGPSNAFNGATTATKTFTYDTNHHLNTVTTQGLGVTDCSQNSYSFDQFGDKTTITKGVGSAGACQSTSTNKTQTFNAYSQLTTAGYLYDALGRNTTIPVADTSTGTNNINLVYDSTDNVTSMTQGSNITTYGYDASGRNQTQTSGSTVTTDHFTDNSDSASYTTQTSGGALQQTDTYAGAIGDGLNITVSVTASGTTSKAQIIDPLGSVVANITIPTSGSAAGPDSFQSFDEYGNPETPANPQSITQTGLQNFGWAGTANRQTESTGLILMGARVYNPVTGQFTSADPIPGGNENSYTYPNDPINGNDFTGMWGWDDTFTVIDIAFTVASFIPVVGEVAMVGKVAMFAYKAYSAASKIAQASKVAIKVAQLTRRVASAVEKAAPRVTNFFKAAAKTCGMRSFTGDTPVALSATETAPIDQLVVGEPVLAFNAETNSLTEQPISQIWRHWDHTSTLHTTQGDIQTTEDHPFFDLTKGIFLEIQDVPDGDQLYTANHKKVYKTGFDFNTGYHWVYNLTVNSAHTYFVGINFILVHNTDNCRINGRLVGDGGTQAHSVTVGSKFRGVRGTRLDWENPAPGSRAGNIHLHYGREKHYYDFSSGSFSGLNRKRYTLIAGRELEHALAQAKKALNVK